METTVSFADNPKKELHTLGYVFDHEGVYQCNFDNDLRFISLPSGHVLLVDKSDGEVRGIDEGDYYEGEAFMRAVERVDVSFIPDKP